MYEIKVIGEFSGAHNLRHYKGKCEELHGHNWSVELSVYGEALDKKGMVIDFHELKGKLKKILSRLDHKNLNDLSCFKTKNPTSENIARYIHDKLSKVINHKIKVAVWETDNSCATFF